MKVTQFTGVTSKDDIKIFKPCGTLLIVQKFDGITDHADAQLDTAKIQIRMVNSMTGNVIDVCPETKLLDLSSICSQGEGYTKRSCPTTYMVEGQPHQMVVGRDEYQVILNRDKSVSLSNDKYLQIKLTDLLADCEYTIYGIEKLGLDDFVNVYQKFYLSAGELEKNLTCSGKEEICLPLSNIEEITLHPESGDNTPVYDLTELCYLNRMLNDISSVRMTPDANNTPVGRLARESDVTVGKNIIDYGFMNYITLPIAGVKSIDLKRSSSNDTVAVFLIDEKK